MLHLKHDERKPKRNEKEQNVTNDEAVNELIKTVIEKLIDDEDAEFDVADILFDTGDFKSRPLTEKQEKRISQIINLTIRKLKGAMV